MIKFAEKWLKTFAILHIIGGLLLPVLVLTPLASQYIDKLALRFSHSNPESLQFLIGVFGPTIASWGILFYYVVKKAFLSRAQRDWLFLLAATLVWGVLDSLYSFYFQVNMHLLINGIALLCLLVPLLIVKKHFK